MADTCTHLDTVADVTPSSTGCEDCLAHRRRWVHLRLCMQCGHVGCCDNSPNRHATEAPHRDAPPDHPLLRAGRGLVVVLRRRAVLRDRRRAAGAVASRDRATGGSPRRSTGRARRHRRGRARRCAGRAAGATGPRAGRGAPRARGAAAFSSSVSGERRRRGAVSSACSSSTSWSILLMMSRSSLMVFPSSGGSSCRSAELEGEHRDRTRRRTLRPSMPPRRHRGVGRACRATAGSGRGSGPRAHRRGGRSRSG